MRIVGSVDIGRPASQVWAYVADYGNDTSWRGGVTQMRQSQPGPAQEGVTTHESLRLLGMTFRTDATIDRVWLPACLSAATPTTPCCWRPWSTPSHRSKGARAEGWRGEAYGIASRFRRVATT